MLIILLAWLFIAVTSFAIGYAVLRMLKSEASGVPLVSLCGLAVLSMLCNWLSLLLPINWLVSIGIGLLSLVLLVIFRHLMREMIRQYFADYRWYSWTLLGWFLLFVLTQSLPIGYLGDEAIYYTQTVRLMSAYPVIVGIGNLAVWFAYNSSVHTLGALYGFTHSGIFLNDLSGYVYVLLVIYTLEGFHSLVRGKWELIPILKVTIVFLCYLRFRGGIVSISPDFVLGIIVLIILISLLEKALTENSPVDALPASVLILTLFAMTIKLSAIILTPVPVVLLVRYQRQWLTITLASLLFLVPYLTRNVLTSGYLLSPVTLVDVFNVDWKMPKETARMGLVGWDYLLHPFLTLQAHARTQENLPSPLRWILLLASCIVILRYYSSNKDQVAKPFYFHLLAFLLLLGLCFWLMMLPLWIFGGIRTAGGFIYFIILLAAALLIHQSRFQSGWRAVLLLVYGILLIKNFFNVEGKYQYLAANALLPPPYLIPETRQVQLAGVTIHIPVDGYCWGAPIPCTLKVDKDLQLRGKDIRSGFRIKP